MSKYTHSRYSYHYTTTICHHVKRASVELIMLVLANDITHSLILALHDVCQVRKLVKKHRLFDHSQFDD